MKHIVILTLGSRGDVQPLIALAIHYKELYPQHKLTLIAPRQFQYMFASLLSKYQIEYHGIEQAIEPSDRIHEMSRVWLACRCLQPIDQLVYTTFVLEGYSIAEKLSIQSSLIVSLFPLGLFPMPEGFEEAVREAFPTQYSDWKYKQKIWDTHMTHWMWRLLLEDQGQFREDVLRLHPVPDLKPDCIPPLVYAIDPGLSQMDNITKGARMCGFWSLSRILEENELEQKETNDTSLTTEPEGSSPTLVINFGSMDALSATLMNPLESSFLRRVRNHLEEILIAFHDLRIVWIVSTEELRTYLHSEVLPTLGLSRGGEMRESLSERVRIIAPVSHAYLLRKFTNIVGIIHHGGVGTCISMIELGLPQMIVPFKFDQFYWSTKLSALGLSDESSDSISWVSVVSNMMKRERRMHVKAVANQWTNKIIHNAQKGLNEVIQILSQS